MRERKAFEVYKLSDSKCPNLNSSMPYIVIGDTVFIPKTRPDYVLTTHETLSMPKSY